MLHDEPVLTSGIGAWPMGLTGHPIASIGKTLRVATGSVCRYAQTCRLHGLAGYPWAEQPGYWGLLTSARLAGLGWELGQPQRRSQRPYPYPGPLR